MDVDKLKELIKVFEASDVNEIVIEEGNAKISLRKGMPLMAAAEAAPGKSSAVDTAVVSEPKEASVAAGSNGDRDPNWKMIVSPMVGTFYRAPAPDAPPFVEVGDTLEPGQTVCILEAMKLMNEITSEEAGVIKEICVDNAQAVQFGQTLVYYEPV